MSVIILMITKLDNHTAEVQFAMKKKQGKFDKGGLYTVSMLIETKVVIG